MKLSAARFLELMELADQFEDCSPEKAGKNLRNAEHYILDKRARGGVYPLHWLLHVDRGGEFSDRKRSNHSIAKTRPSLTNAGYENLTEENAGFNDVWDELIEACGRIGRKFGSLDLKPSKRTGRPDWTGRKFWIHCTYFKHVHGLPIEQLAKQDLEAAQEFQSKIRESLSLNDAARQLRLKNAKEYPKRIHKVVSSYQRNPDVVAQRLLIAAGICEQCGSAAPFNRKSDDSPFLEVHHILFLTDGGKDTVENTRALCPNCHREVHFG